MTKLCTHCTYSNISHIVPHHRAANITVILITSRIVRNILMGRINANNAISCSLRRVIKSTYYTGINTPVVVLIPERRLSIGSGIVALEQFRRTIPVLIIG